MTIHLPAIGPDLPVHPRTGLRAIGLRRNGQPIWPVRGGSGDGDDSDNGDDGDDTEPDDGDGEGGDDKPLGPAGEKALEAEKDKRRKAQSSLRPWAALARELGVKTPDEVKALIAGKKKTGGEVDQVDPEQIRREARAEAQRETLNDRVLDKIEAKARRFADPADAAALLLREHGVDDFLDGARIDADAIAEALDELLEKKPYLAAAAETKARKGPKPDPSQGSRGGAKAPAADRATKRLERLGIRKPSSTT